MADYVVAGLVKRRAELTGEADALRTRVTQIAADIAHLDAVIRQFDPDFDLAAIRPKRVHAVNAAGRGETCRFVLDVLREAVAPMTTADIAARLIAKHGMEGQDRQGRHRAMGRVGIALRRQRENGIVRSVSGPGQFVLWEIITR
jgi:hypothetical protein